MAWFASYLGPQIGAEAAPVLLFFNGLEMQEMWMPYCVYMLKDYPPFQANDFEYLRGRILILLPENDIFKRKIRNGSQICSGNWMQRFTMFRAVMWASLFRRNGILI